MSQITQLSVLVFAFVLFHLISTAEAVQWPVNGGPVHQPVPQYRTSYPLFETQQKLKAGPTVPHDVQQQPESILAEPDRSLEPNPATTADPLPEPTPTPKPEIRPLKPTTVAPSNSGMNQPRRYQLDQPAKPVEKQLTKEQATKKKKPNPPAINYDIYRDRNPLPIDPRKPCGICTNPAVETGCGCGPLCDAPGFRGKPFQEREPGGCRCGDKKCGKCKPMFSLYWPRPFSAKLDEHFPEQAAARYSPCQKKRLVDAFDKFTDFKLVDYHRKDNGYCGEDADPYGCLGENRMIASGVAGVGYRFPSVPVDRSASRQTFWY